MAFEFPGQIISLISSGNLSAKQYRPINLSAAGNAVLATTTGGLAIGVLQNTPSTAGGDAASVMIYGVTKAQKDSTTVAVDEGDAIVVKSTLGGLGRGTAGLGYILGRAMSPLAAGTTGLFSLLITHQGDASTGHTT